MDSQQDHLENSQYYLSDCEKLLPKYRDQCKIPRSFRKNYIEEDPRRFNFEICSKTLEQKLKVNKNIINIETSDVCFDNDLKKLLQCFYCKKIAIEPIKECKKCQNLRCGKCQDDQISYNCCYSTETNKIKPINRIFKELALNKVRFRHVCRPQLELDDFLTLKLEEMFDIIAPSRDLFILLLFFQFNVKDSFSDCFEDYEMMLEKLPDVQKINKKKLEANRLWPIVQQCNNQDTKLGQLSNQQFEIDNQKNEINQQTKLQKLDENQNSPVQEIDQKNQDQQTDKIVENKIQNQDQQSETSQNLNKRQAKALEKSDNQSNCQETDLHLIRKEFFKQVDQMRPKIFKYKEYLNHLESDCQGFRPFKCHPECQVQQMNLDEYRDHLEFDCLFMNFKCKTCSFTEQRKYINMKHLQSDCIKHLKEEYSSLKTIENTNLDLKNEIKDLQQKVVRNVDERGSRQQLPLELVLSSSDSSVTRPQRSRPMVNDLNAHRSRRSMQRRLLRNMRVENEALRQQQARNRNRIYRERQVQRRQRDTSGRELREQQINFDLAFQQQNSSGTEDNLF